MITPGSRERLFASLTVVGLATLLPELVSGNSDVQVMLRPVPLMLFAITYGLPALVLREISVRTSSGLPGLFVSGLAYGVFNEALLSKATFRAGGLPVALDALARPEFGWGALVYVALWQACAGVVFPVALAHSLFPWQSNASWLNRLQLTMLTVPPMALGALVFLSPQGIHQGTLLELAGWLLLVVGLLIVAGRLRGPWAVRPAPLVTALAAGPAFVAFLTAAVVLAGLEPPAPVFLLLVAGGVGVLAWGLTRLRLATLPALGIVALGWYLVTALLAHRDRPGWSLAVAVLLLAVVALAVGRTQRRLALANPAGTVGAWNGAPGRWSSVSSWWERVVRRRPPVAARRP